MRQKRVSHSGAESDRRWPSSGESRPVVCHRGCQLGSNFSPCAPDHETGHWGGNRQWNATAGRHAVFKNPLIKKGVAIRECVRGLEANRYTDR